MISAVPVMGLITALFLPGFFITLIFFKEVNVLERLMLSITFSIMISIAVGIGLGYNKNVKELTGGITHQNVWKWELVITFSLMVIAVAVNRKSINLSKIKSSIINYKIPIKKSSKEK